MNPETKFLQFIFCGLLVGVVGCGQASKNTAEQPTKPDRPNVLFILADDLGMHDLGVTGSQYYETPNIDRIAKAGTIFTQGYTASPVCSPARASIFTGQFTARHGVTDWIGAPAMENWRASGRNTKLMPPQYQLSLPQADTTLAEAMKTQGYTTFFAGKWHLGGEGQGPNHHGFDYNIGGWEVGSPKGGYFSPWDNPHLENKANGENLSIRLAKETAQFIKRQKEKPFFAFLSFYAVHGPIQTTQEKWQKYRDKADSMGIAKKGFTMERLLPIRTQQDNPVYAGLLSTMDDAVGLVLQALADAGVADNTIVVFTSDNGGVASGDAYATTNRPLRGGKGYQWEGGIRAPYFIKAPGQAYAKKINYPVTGADFFPTILALTKAAQMPAQHTDGINLVPLMKNEPLPQRALYWHYPHYGNQGGEPHAIVRKGVWKLIHYWEDEHHELYNLDKDPSEQNDAASSYPHIADTLYAELERYLNQVGAKRPQADPEYDAALAKQTLLGYRQKLWPRLEAQRINYLAKDYQPNADWWGSQVETIENN